MSTSPTKILLLAANPLSTDRLSLDEEVRAIEQTLRQSPMPFDLVSEWAVRSSELVTCVLRHRPRIVHFSGHGNKDEELMLVGNDPQQVASVPADVLRDVFRSLGKSILCVVLNACYTETQARAIIEAVPCAVGMSSAVLDVVAIAFAQGFYEALGFGESVASAHRLACTRIALAQHGSQREVPRLLVQPGIDPESLFLTPPSPSTIADKAVSKPRQPTKPSLRLLLIEVLRTADLLDAFVLDYFSEVYEGFSAGMTRDQRRNILLESVKPDVVLAKLRQSKPKQVAESESLLTWEE